MIESEISISLVDNDTFLSQGKKRADLYIAKYSSSSSIIITPIKDMSPDLMFKLFNPERNTLNPIDSSHTNVKLAKDRGSKLVSNIKKVFDSSVDALFLDSESNSYLENVSVTISIPKINRIYTITPNSNEPVPYSKYKHSTEQCEKYLIDFNLTEKIYRDVYFEHQWVPYEQIDAIHNQRIRKFVKVCRALTDTGSAEGNIVALLIPIEHVIIKVLENDEYLYEILKQCKDLKQYQSEILQLYPHFFDDCGGIDFNWILVDSNLIINSVFFISDDGFDALKTNIKSTFFNGIVIIYSLLYILLYIYYAFFVN